MFRELKRAETNMIVLFCAFLFDFRHCCGLSELRTEFLARTPWEKLLLVVHGFDVFHFTWLSRFLFTEHSHN